MITLKVNLTLAELQLLRDTLQREIVNLASEVAAARTSMGEAEESGSEAAIEAAWGHVEDVLFRRDRFADLVSRLALG